MADQSSHDFNPTTGLSREQYRDNWMSSGSQNLDQLKAWLAQNGGQLMSDSGLVQTPYGDTLDMEIGAKTGNGRPGWTDVGAQNQAQGSQFNPGSFGAFGPSNPGFQKPMNPGAMPYNPHASQNTGFAGGINRQPFGQFGSGPGIQPTGQTDGTLLGTQMSAAQNVGPVGQPNYSFQPMQNSWMPGQQDAHLMSQSPMGAPSFYQQQKTPTSGVLGAA